MFLNFASFSAILHREVTFVPCPLFVRFTLGYILGQIVLTISGTSLAPMISAICLPILVSTTSPVYILAAGVLTTLIILIRLLLEHTGIKQKNSFSPSKADVKTVLPIITVRSLAVLLLSFVLFNLNIKFAAVVISVLLIVLIRLFHMVFPPAGAIAILAMLIPQEAVVTYPLQIALGISLLTLISMPICLLTKRLTDVMA